MSGKCSPVVLRPSGLVLNLRCCYDAILWIAGILENYVKTKFKKSLGIFSSVKIYCSQTPPNDYRERAKFCSQKTWRYIFAILFAQFPLFVFRAILKTFYAISFLLKRLQCFC